jgi:hypothetical protein
MTLVRIEPNPQSPFPPSCVSGCCAGGISGSSVVFAAQLGTSRLGTLRLGTLKCIHHAFHRAPALHLRNALNANAKASAAVLHMRVNARSPITAGGLITT